MSISYVIQIMFYILFKYYDNKINRNILIFRTSDLSNLIRIYLLKMLWPQHIFIKILILEYTQYV